MITIIDYKMGNLGSIKNMLKKIGCDATITSEIQKISKSEKIILPGVGAFDKAIQNIKELNLIDILKKKVIQDKVTVLGICLGMQLLAKGSEEGTLAGLGFIDGYVKKFNFKDKNNLKIPHMGWNTINVKKQHPLFFNMYNESRFYFVHSYHVVCNDKDDVLTTTNFGFDFVSAVAKDNIIGVQFHPEKSRKFGMKLIKNFIEEV